MIAGAFAVVLTLVVNLHRMEGNHMFPSVRDGDLGIFYRLTDCHTDDVVLYTDKTGQVTVGRIIAVGRIKGTQKPLTKINSITRRQKTMKKNAVKGSLGAIALASVMTMSMGTPVFAEERPIKPGYDTVIGGTKTTAFDKYLVMDKVAEVPNASFTYAVTAGRAKAYDVKGKKFEVLAGVDADKVTMAGVGSKTAGTITYKPGDATLNDENALVKDYDNSFKKYAKKTATLDFSACRFTEPGIYRYIVTESGTNQAVTNDADATRVVDVYVMNDDSDDNYDYQCGKLKIAGYVLHSNADDAPDVSLGENHGSAGSYAGTKSQGFTNSYDTSNIMIRKEVSGNQASRDKYFEFTVSITGAVPGTVYHVALLGAPSTTPSNAATITANEGKTNPTTLTVGADGTVTQKFYLAHGQEIWIGGVAKDTKYKVTENAEDYKSTSLDAVDHEDRAETPVVAPSGTIASEDILTGYVNTRDGVIPTGVIMTVAPFAAVTLLGGVGAVTMVMKKRKSSEEE